MAITVCAQTQQGFVKTKGRMVNGKHVKGQGLNGALVTIQGHNAVLTKTGGAFSFPVTSKTFTVQNVRKQGYQLVDADALTKPYQFSSNTFYLVMETPEQQMQDKLDAERKLRRTLQRQLQQREDEIEAMNISLAEKQQLMQQLFEDQKRNDKLIADMAKQYAEMDYDQMDSLNQVISDCILNGELLRADSLLRSKGDMRSRIAIIRKEQNIETQREAELVQQQADLAASKEGTRKKLEDAAADCYKFFDRFKLDNQHDSAAYYVELRAELDTTNADWQFDAGYYCCEQNQFQKAEPYYTRVLRVRRQHSRDNPEVYEPFLVATLCNLANLYADTQRLAEAEHDAREGLKLDSTQQWIATPLAPALLFRGKYDEAEKIYRQYKNEEKDIFLEDLKKFAEAGVIPKEYEADVEKIKKMLIEE